MTEQIGLRRFKLVQKRYKDGAFYWSAIMDGGRARAFDGRFMLEEGNKLTPTKNGFRMPADKLDHLKRTLAGDLRRLEDSLIVENKAFQFHVRYVNDKYGEGIDFRKYRTSDNYHGWDKSGIRMKLEDVATLRDWLSEFQPQGISLSHNLFAEKAIGGGDVDTVVKHGNSGETINPTLAALLQT